MMILLYFNDYEIFSLSWLNKSQVTVKRKLNLQINFFSNHLNFV